MKVFKVWDLKFMMKFTEELPLECMGSPDVIKHPQGEILTPVQVHKGQEHLPLNKLCKKLKENHLFFISQKKLQSIQYIVTKEEYLMAIFK